MWLRITVKNPAIGKKERIGTRFLKMFIQLCDFVHKLCRLGQLRENVVEYWLVPSFGYDFFRDVPEIHEFLIPPGDVTVQVYHEDSVSR